MQIDIGLSSWVIQDGNYPEFETGKEYRFALEFFSRDAASTRTASAPSLRPAGQSLYDACGRIIHVDDECWLVDFGVPAYRDGAPPAWAKKDAWIRGRFHLGVDPFMYFESHAGRAGVPDIFRRWRIDDIRLVTGPWIESPDTDRLGRKILMRDETRRGSISVPATDAWNHEDGNGDYLLRCALLTDSPP